MNKQDDARRKRLRRLVKGEDEAVQVTSEELRWLLDETGRLQQANDRLRKQNKRLRLRRGEDGAATDDEEV
ncbi:MAG: hypothetical protein VX044_09375 [Planctomycetota bacterium]|nr:hypothetical protein [Planctomycetota bacterium]